MTATLDDLITTSGDTIPPPDTDVPLDSVPKVEDVCDQCGKPLVYSGRGRHPTRCEEHRRGAAKAPRAGGGVRQTASIERISLHTAMLAETAGRLIGMVEAFDGFVIRTNAEPLGKAVGNIAERDPAFRRKMEAMLARTSYAELIALSMAMMTPIAIHHGAIRMDAESRLNYEQAYREANSDVGG